MSDCVYGVFVTLIFFSCLLLFWWSGKCNDVNQKSMCHESCQISVGNLKQFFFLYLKMKTFCLKLCSSCRQMNKVYPQNTTFVYLAWTWQAWQFLLLFSTENLTLPWQWWLHQHWAVLAVNRLSPNSVTMTLTLKTASHWSFACGCTTIPSLVTKGRAV